MGQGGGAAENRDTYLQLAVTVLSAICRVPEIAASEDMRANIPLILEVVSKVYVYHFVKFISSDSAYDKLNICSFLLAP